MESKEMKSYDTEMDVADWTEGMYRGVLHIRTGIWLLVALEIAKFVLW